MRINFVVTLGWLAFACGAASASALYPTGLPACVSPFDANCQAATAGGYTIVSSNSAASQVYAVVTGDILIGFQGFTAPNTDPLVQAAVLAAENQLAMSPSACADPAQEHCYAENPGGALVVTNSVTSTFIDVDTPITQRIDHYSTTIAATVNGFQTVFDQTFPLPFSDPTVQAAVLQADAILNSGNATFGAPVLSAGSTALSGSQLTNVVIGQALDGNQVVTTTTAFGPATIGVGEDQADLFFVVPGQSDININTENEYDLFRNAITTNTFLTTETYDINGATTQANSAPEPGTLWSGGAALLAILLRRYGSRAKDALGATSPS